MILLLGSQICIVLQNCVLIDFDPDIVRYFYGHSLIFDIQHLAVNTTCSDNFVTFAQA